jgi:hypothetical protein
MRGRLATATALRDVSQSGVAAFHAVVDGRIYPKQHWVVVKLLSTRTTVAIH